MNKNPSSPPRVAVIGAGLSGLVLAHALQKKGVDVAVLESSSRTGGAIESHSIDGFLCENGPNTLLLSDHQVSGFLDEIGLLSTAINPQAHAKKRFIVHRGKLLALPANPLQALTNPFLSPRGKCGLISDIFVRRGENPHETVHHFFTRHFGEECATELAGPFVSGIFAGDPERLIMRHAFPAVWELDQKEGSIIRGMLKKRLSSADQAVKRRLLSWEKGLGMLIDTLEGKLAGQIIKETGAMTLSKKENGFAVNFAGDSKVFHQVIVTTPVHSSQKILAPLLSNGHSLPTLPCAPMVVIHLGYDTARIGHALDGFGVLIKRELGYRTLGCLFSSHLFAGRAPEGKSLLTAFIGGRLDPGILDLDDKELLKVTKKELGELLQISGEECFVNIKRWQHAIPQYESDYDSYLEDIHHLQKNYPGLYLSGNSIGGISLPQCIKNNLQLAEKLFLEHPVSTSQSINT